MAKGSIIAILISFAFCSIFPSMYADDSLQSLYNENIRALKTKDTLAIVKSYKYLANYLGELNDLQKSNTYFLKGLTLAKQANLIKDIGIINNALGNNASVDGRRQEAIAYYSKALKSFVDIKLLNKVAMTMMNIGTEYESLGNYKMAIAYELKALKNKERSGDFENLGYYYQHIGQLFKTTDINKWKFYVDKAYTLTKQPDLVSISTRTAIFNDLGGIAEKLNNYKEAYQWYDSMYVLSKQENYANGMETALSNRSLLLKADKRYPEALKDILEALAIAKEMDRPYSIITANIHTSSILLDMERATEARQYAFDALKITQDKKNYPEEEADAHRILAKIAEKTGEWKVAYLHLSAYRAGLDSIRSTEIEKTLQELETKYQTSEKEKRIAKLANENKINQLRLSKNRAFLASLIVGILLISLLVIFWYRRKRLIDERKQAELKQRLLRSQMNPHFIFNTLNAINHFIQTKQGTEASDYLARYAKLMRQILENSAVEYVLLADEISFLENYLTMQKLRFNANFEFQILVDDCIDAEELEIPPMLAQPFVENAIEHGLRSITEGGLLTIGFQQSDRGILMIISDNGVGFNAKAETKTHRSFAMEITKERLAILGKHNDVISIESPIEGTSRGTKVIVEVPIRTVG